MQLISTDQTRLRTGIVIVDHGSRRAESNRMLEEVARRFAERFEQTYGIVEPAHMELSEPSIATAYAACVKRGATKVVVVPFFLGPGKHWTADIPRLTADAAADHPGTTFHVSPTLGIDELILDLLAKRANHCVGHDYSCELCQGTLRSGEPAQIALAAEAARAAAHAAASGHPVTCSTCPYKGMPLPSGGAVATAASA